MECILDLCSRYTFQEDLAQTTVKIETWVQSLSLEDPLEKGMATHSSILAWQKFHGLYSPWGCKESDTTEQLSLSLHH